MKRVFSRDSFETAKETYVPRTGPATAKAEQQAHKTGKLHQLVDPSGYGVIRRSLPRFEKQENGFWLFLMELRWQLKPDLTLRAVWEATSILL